MKTTRLLPLICLLLTATFSLHGKADSFDDAVNEFLDGFEYCKEAKTHLSGKRLSQAQAALAQYRQHLKQASALNPEILTTSKRGMDSNLKYCQRVSRDVEVEAGTPKMNEALASCDAAEQALKDKNPQLASEKLAEYRERKVQALKQAPSLKDIFTIKNQISRCERIEAKIAAFSTKHKALALSIETARIESAAYLSSCQKTRDMLKSEKVDDAVLRDANQGLASANSHKRNVSGEDLAQQEFKRNPQHPDKKQVADNLAQGDQCNAELVRLIADKQQELKLASQKFARYNGQLNAANLSCQQARKITPEATQSAYDTAKTDYNNALQLRNSVRDALSRDKNYANQSGRDDVAQIDRQMRDLNQCLDNTKTRLAATFAALSGSAAATGNQKPGTGPATASASVPAVTAAPVSVPTPVPSTPQVAPAAEKPAQAQAGSKNATPARLVTGTLQLNDLAPEFALFYVPDNTAPQAPEIIVERTGFNQSLYIVPHNAALNIKNRDNTAHRVSATNDASRINETLVRLQPRQSKTSKASWPEHSIITLRTDRGIFPNSYLAILPSANYQRLEFSGNTQVALKFSNDKRASTFYLVMPDMDLLTFTLNGGETKSLALTRAGVPVGSLLVTGE